MGSLKRFLIAIVHTGRDQKTSYFSLWAGPSSQGMRPNWKNSTRKSGQSWGPRFFCYVLVAGLMKIKTSSCSTTFNFFYCGAKLNEMLSHSKGGGKHEPGVPDEVGC